MILYVLFAFAIYTFIPVTSNYCRKLAFSKPDFVVLTLNALFSATIMYIVFYAFDLEKFTGLLAIIFAVSYICWVRFVETQWIIYGFVKRFAFMRRFGLALSVLAVVKLFYSIYPI